MAWFLSLLFNNLKTKHLQVVNIFFISRLLIKET